MQVNHVHCGDSLDVLKRFPDNSVDSVVTDPPYELGFMGKSWDRTGIANSVELWAEVLRVLKPGGHLLSFGGTRTYHRMACAIEDAGFEIRDQLQWLYGTGFPKSMNISKAIDKAAGAEREVVGTLRQSVSFDKGKEGGGATWGDSGTYDVTAPATEAAKQWDGWGTALKPANEPIVLARKPLIERTIAANVLKWGTGGLNIDGSRVPTSEVVRNHSRSASAAKSKGKYGDSKSQETHQTPGQKLGRFPANVILDESAAAHLDEQSGDRPTGALKPYRDNHANASSYRMQREKTYVKGAETGGASRFFYVAKASRRERTHNGQVENKHPTVKPLKLMEYLIKLINPPGGVVLDPFCGSGSTLVAAKGLGFDYIGIDMEQEYVELTNQRLAATPNEAEQAALF